MRGRFAIPVFGKLEVLGVLSFGMNGEQFDKLCAEFEDRFSVEVLMPVWDGAPLLLPELVRQATDAMRTKMCLGDALFLITAQSHPSAVTFVTWNARHFVGKTRLEVLTPAEFLAL